MNWEYYDFLGFWYTHTENIRVYLLNYNTAKRVTVYCGEEQYSYLSSKSFDELKKELTLFLFDEDALSF